MMDHLIEKLHTGPSAVVLLHEGNVSAYSGVGVRSLYHLLHDAPEKLLDSKLAVKAVGSTAAKAMVEGRVAEVYADIISETAADILKDAGVRLSYDRKVPHREFLHVWERLGELSNE